MEIKTPLTLRGYDAAGSAVIDEPGRTGLVTVHHRQYTRTDLKAKDIVTAVNCHDDLLEACQDAIDMYDEIQPVGGWQHVADQLRHAIARVRREQKQ